MRFWPKAWTLVPGMALLLCAFAAKAVNLPVNDAICAAEVANAERIYGIPPALLHSISIVESGRYDPDRRAVIAWPWTVMAEGKGRYFAAKAEAIAEVRKLKARGVQNIDVGCMQVNLRYHPSAFANLEEAFDPSANVGYAARFLMGLFDATGHWPTAASYYHSQTPSLAAIYREKLMKVWNGTGADTEATGGGTRMASARPPSSPKVSTYKPVPGAPALQPVPGAPDVEAKRRAWRDQVQETKNEAALIAAAYRQARIAEYQLRRAHFQEIRSNAATSTKR